MNSALRPMSFGELLDRMTFLYRNHFSVFAGIAVLPAMVGAAFRLVRIATGTDWHPNETNGEAIVFMAQATLELLVSGILGLLATGATVHAVSKLHLGHEAGVRESYAAIKPLFRRIVRLALAVYVRILGPFLGSLLVFLVCKMITGSLSSETGLGQVLGVAATIGTMISGLAIALAVVWGLAAITQYSLAVPACILENISIKAALRRTDFLTPGRIADIWLIFILTFVVSLAFRFVLEYPAIMIHSIHGSLAIAVPIGKQIAHFMADILSGPILTISLVLLYYDQRIRLEAFDLQAIMQSLQHSADTLPASGRTQFVQEVHSDRFQ